jgi:hypothetical protein
MQPVAGPGRPYAPRGLEPTTDVVFVGTLFHRATNAAGKSGRITGSDPVSEAESWEFWRAGD